MATINGSSGNDTLSGTDEPDTITGQGGDDQISDEDGSDSILGGEGNDTIFGSGDNDILNGGADADTIIIDQLGSAGVNNTSVDGGSKGDDQDTLDIRPLLNDGWTVSNLVQNPETNGNPGFDGQIQLQRGGDFANINFTDIENLIVCFTPGARIVTPRGERLVEDLRAGDKVLTRDNGLREIRWIGRRDLSPAELARTPEFQPILIRKGALGGDAPERDMLVSPNHRMLLCHPVAELIFAEREVLAAAKHLTGLDGVERAVTENVSYIHLMFDNHEVILADGAWSESFQPGDYSLQGVGQATRNEILSLFPELATPAGLNGYPAARRSLKAGEARLLITETF